MSELPLSGSLGMPYLTGDPDAFVREELRCGLQVVPDSSSSPSAVGCNLQRRKRYSAASRERPSSAHT